MAPSTKLIHSWLAQAWSAGAEAGKGAGRAGEELTVPEDWSDIIEQPEKLKGTTHSYQTKHEFDSTKCHARMFKNPGGFEVQCSRIFTDDEGQCLCGIHQKQFLKLPEGAKDIPFGRYNQERPQYTLNKAQDGESIPGDKLVWSDQKQLKKEASLTTKNATAAKMRTDLNSWQVTHDGIKGKQLTLLYNEELAKRDNAIDLEKDIDDNTTLSPQQSEEDSDSETNTGSDSEQEKSSPQAVSDPEKLSTPEPALAEDLEIDDNNELVEPEPEPEPGSEPESEPGSPRSEPIPEQEPDPNLEPESKPDQKPESAKDAVNFEDMPAPHPDGNAAKKEVEEECSDSTHPSNVKDIREFFKEKKEIIEALDISLDSLRGKTMYLAKYEEIVKAIEEHENQDEDGDEDGDETDSLSDDDEIDYVESTYEEIDYLEDENSDKVFNLQKQHVGDWDENGDIQWKDESFKIAHKSQVSQLE